VTLDDHTHDLAAHIGSALRQHRDRHRLSQAELAERAAISQSAVARIERGGRGGPRIDTLARLFAVLARAPRCSRERRFRRRRWRSRWSGGTLAGSPCGWTSSTAQRTANPG
jgi:transcriptional regulator with XRE-family HTH domain